MFGHALHDAGSCPANACEACAVDVAYAAMQTSSTRSSTPPLIRHAHDGQAQTEGHRQTDRLRLAGRQVQTNRV